MLEYLIFHRGGYFGGNEWLVIQNVHGKLELDYYFFSREYPREVFPHQHALWTKERSRRWLAKLEAIPLDTWERVYWADVCDGEQWSVRYRFAGEKAREISGSNAWPEDWDSLSGLMGSIARKLPVVETMDLQEITGAAMKRLSEVCKKAGSP